MIVCTRCGHHNAAKNEFCDSCGVFLEWEGVHVSEPGDDMAPGPLPPPQPGLVTRIKHAVLGDGPPPLPPPTVPMPAPDGRVPGHDAAVAHEPSAQQPAPPLPRPKPHVVTPPSRTVQPGDLVCGTCGEVNGSERSFCRRCGTTLAEVIPVRRHWWQRSASAGTGRATVTTADSSARRAADGRAGGAGRAGGSSAAASAAPGGARRRGRRAKGKVLGGYGRIRRVVALLAIVGIGSGLAVPSLRSAITSKGGDLLNTIKRTVNPEYRQVGPDNTLSVASSAVAGHEATMVADGGANTYWLGAPDAQDATVTLTFSPPTRLAQILITSGDQEDPANFKAQPRPKDVFVRAMRADGSTITSRQIALDDKASPQKFSLDAKDVAQVAVTVQSCYPDPALHVCALTEIEFFQEK